MASASRLRAHARLLSTTSAALGAARSAATATARASAAASARMAGRCMWQSVAESVPAVAAATRLAAPSSPAMRWLNLHEFQSKDLLEAAGVCVQRGKMATSAKAAGDVARWIRSSNPKAELVLKAQIHAGGRGKGVFSNGFKGGVKLCDSPAQVEEYAAQMLGHRLVTKQTGAAGQLVQKVLVNEGITIHRELYFAILMDRKYNGPVVVASTQGGVDIEEVAERNPAALITMPVSIATGMTDAQARELAGKLGFTGALADKAVKQFQALYKLFISTDATQVEINPLVEGSVPGGESGLVLAVDAKLNFDDNASFRQQKIYAMRDKSMEDPRDVAAEEAGLNYIGLDGNIGCLVNGAGLAMATMDIIKLHGGAPANFLDVGGGATAEQVTKAFKILTSDPQVKAILVNIFGGIMKCDTIAQGIIAAAKEVSLTLPLVVRLEGTNVERGRQLLRDSGIKITTADNLDDAAKRAVATLK